jgi:hypothetical protein
MKKRLFSVSKLRMDSDCILVFDILDLFDAFFSGFPHLSDFLKLFFQVLIFALSFVQSIPFVLSLFIKPINLINQPHYCIIYKGKLVIVDFEFFEFIVI